LWAAAVWLGWVLPLIAGISLWAWLLWTAPHVRWFTAGGLIGLLFGCILAGPKGGEE